MTDIERKRGFTKPRGTLPKWVVKSGIVYNDTEYPFRYVFTTPTEGHVEVQSEDGSWIAKAEEFRKWRRRDLTITLSECREAAASAIADWFSALMLACAIAVNGESAVHILGEDGKATWCGIAYYYHSANQHGVRQTTTNVVKITCRECRMKVINAVNAMPFLDAAAQADA